MGKILKDLGIPHFRFHDLRAYAVSIAHALGVPDAYIQEWGGWKTDHVLKRVYRRAMDDKNKEYRDKLKEHFSRHIDTDIDTNN
jgi:integrase